MQFHCKGDLVVAERGGQGSESDGEEILSLVNTQAVQYAEICHNSNVRKCFSSIV